jgi:hypothetical protein
MNIDEILIGVFISFFAVFVIAWGVIMLTWRKKYFNTLIPCFQ